MTQTTFRLNAAPEGMAPSDFMQPESFTTNDRTELNLFAYAEEDESILSGVWEVGPTREDYPDGYPVHEMMHVIKGAIIMTHPNGTVETFSAGDTFFIPKGSPCTWETKELTRKFYMIAA